MSALDNEAPPRVAGIAWPSRMITLQFNDDQGPSMRPFVEWLKIGAAWAAFADWYDEGNYGEHEGGEGR